jgi:hypothetical protein
MNIEVDYNPYPSESYFISVSLNNKESISFDKTIKGHRAVKQILIDKKPFPTDQSISSEWETIILKGGKFVKKYHVKWIDMGRKDWCNNEIWETVKEQSLSDEVTDKLLKYSQLISQNYKKLTEFSNEMKDFEQLLSEEIKKFN